MRSRKDCIRLQIPALPGSNPPGGPLPHPRTWCTEGSTQAHRPLPFLQINQGECSPYIPPHQQVHTTQLKPRMGSSSSGRYRDPDGHSGTTCGPHPRAPRLTGGGLVYRTASSQGCSLLPSGDGSPSAWPSALFTPIPANQPDSPRVSSSLWLGTGLPLLEPSLFFLPSGPVHMEPPD